MYFFAGLAKLNPEWLRGYPMRPWLLAAATDAFTDVIGVPPSALPPSALPVRAFFALPEVGAAIITYGGRWSVVGCPWCTVCSPDPFGAAIITYGDWWSVFGFSWLVVRGAPSSSSSSASVAGGRWSVVGDVLGRLSVVHHFLLPPPLGTFVPLQSRVIGCSSVIHRRPRL